MNAIFKKHKPVSNKDIAQFKVPKNGLYTQYSVYYTDGIFYLCKGLLFNVNQNHEIIKQSKHYKTIINTILK